VAEQPAAQSPAFIPVEKEPRAVNLTNPVIPDYAWLSMKDAIVVAKVLIAKDGTPSDAQIVKSTSSIFDEPVLKAIKNSQFAPARCNRDRSPRGSRLRFVSRSPDDPDFQRTDSI